MSNLRTLFGLCLLSALLVLRLTSANVVTTGVNGNHNDRLAKLVILIFALVFLSHFPLTNLATLLAEPNDEIPCDVTLAECRAWCHPDIRLPTTNCGTDYCCVLTD